MSTEKPFKQIFVQLQNGIMVPINELPKESYEYFLELTHQVRLAYIAIKDGSMAEKMFKEPKV